MHLGGAELIIILLIIVLLFGVNRIGKIGREQSSRIVSEPSRLTTRSTAGGPCLLGWEGGAQCALRGLRWKRRDLLVLGKETIHSA